MPIQTDPSGVPDLLTTLQAYTKCPLHLLTRLDRPVSGLVLAVKSSSHMAYFQTLLKEQRLQKTYYAITAQRPVESSGELVHWLEANPRKNITKLSPTALPGYQRSQLTYTIVASSDRYHLWKISLLTGRHHQIRAQLSALGCPIQGDTKYGAPRANRTHFIHLHAAQLAFPHPISKQLEIYSAPPALEAGLWKVFLAEFASLGHE